MKRAHGLFAAPALALTVALTLGACVGTTEPTSTAKGIGLQPPAATIAVGATQQFTAFMTPPDLVPGGVAAILWSSSNTGVATVSNAGLVTGVGAGQAAIVITAGQYRATASIRVLAP